MLSVERNIEKQNGDIVITSPSILFDGADELLSDTLDVDHSISNFGISGSKDDNDPSITGFDHLEFLHPYNESGPSSVRNSELRDVSEAAGSHMSTAEDVDINWNEENGVNGLSAHAVDGLNIDGSGSFTPATEFTNSHSDVHDRISPIQEALLRTVTPDKPELIRRQWSSTGRAKTTKISPQKSSLRAVESASPETPGLQENFPDNAKFSPYQSGSKQNLSKMRPKSSIPPSLSPIEFARQCILAADSSRLNPFALHPGEYKTLREHITHPQVTIYLNIRNAILRLWTRNPMVGVTKEEAAGCARESRFFSLALVAYEWLVRNGYINSGCIELGSTTGTIPRAKSKGKRRVIVIIGAGMSGLGCARQLEGLIAQLGYQFTEQGEKPPKVIVLEGRKRIGGRVYSHQLRTQHGGTLPKGLRSTAEMGAMIVTGFEHGNPLNVLIRGQLGLHYHALRDNSVLYDHDGTKVDRGRDVLVEKLYNDILERASTYRNKSIKTQTVEGDREMIETGRDSSSEHASTIAQLEDSGTSVAVTGTKRSTAKGAADNGPAGVVGVAGRGYQLAATMSTGPAAQAAQAMGWEIRPEIATSSSIDVKPVRWTSDQPTLGDTMDDAITQYQQILGLTHQDMRLLNWHHANLEYANAANVSQLSLGGWDQDIGNEFEGEHTEIIGGYTQVPRGLYMCPTPLDVRFGCNVRTIKYSSEMEAQRGTAVVIECENGETFEADHVVVTTPLGVLKGNGVQFQPTLPDWKQGAIDRLGFGLLNKVVLVYEQPFWEADRDIFGLLNEAEVAQSMSQKQYSRHRGRFYLFWNCIQTSGRPMLIALMAGDAAHETETANTLSLISEVTARLSKVFAPKVVPPPSEVIITRWKKDRFARGSYSYMGPHAQPGDYDAMAQPVGRLHFAGEATCGTHPATVHGAYLSGLRAASEVVESILGPINVEKPLIPPKSKAEMMTPVNTSGQKRKHEDAVLPPATNASSRQARNEYYEASIIGAILNEIGERPVKPGRPGNNPFILYQSAHWYPTKAKCDDEKRRVTGDPNAKASKQDIRNALGLAWRTASEDVKQPYLDSSKQAREMADAWMTEYKEKSAIWDREAARIRREYVENHPLPGGAHEMFVRGTAIELGDPRKSRKSDGTA